MKNSVKLIILAISVLLCSSILLSAKAIDPEGDGNRISCESYDPNTGIHYTIMYGDGTRNFYLRSENPDGSVDWDTTKDTVAMIRICSLGN